MREALSTSQRGSMSRLFALGPLLAVYVAAVVEAHWLQNFHRHKLCTPQEFQKVASATSQAFAAANSSLTVVHPSFSAISVLPKLDPWALALGR